MSIDPPAGLPRARSLIERALLHQIAGLLTPTDLNFIIDRPIGLKTRPGEFLRFETAMAQLPAATRAHVLGNLQSGAPNSNHYALAQLVEHGEIIITTNFDVHIETAYKHLYGRDCRVARRDEDFALAPCRETAGVLWKIHGCLADFATLADTFTAVLARGSSRMKWFRNILSSFDIIVLGYSGSDDLDLIPPFAQTVTDHSLLWIDHAENDESEWITPEQRVARTPARMHLDCVGLTRVMYSCHSERQATRRPDHAIILVGRTRAILRRILRWVGISPRIPAGSPPMPAGYAPARHIGIRRIFFS